MKKKPAGKLKRDIAMFLSSEEGKILKKDIVKIAAVLGIAGGALLQTEDASAYTPAHANYLHNSGGGGGHYSV